MPPCGYWMESHHVRPRAYVYIKRKSIFRVIFLPGLLVCICAICSEMSNYKRNLLANCCPGGSLRTTQRNLKPDPETGLIFRLCKHWQSLISTWDQQKFLAPREAFTFYLIFVMRASAVGNEQLLTSCD